MRFKFPHGVALLALGEGDLVFAADEEGYFDAPERLKGQILSLPGFSLAKEKDPEDTSTPLPDSPAARHAQKR